MSVPSFHTSNGPPFLLFVVVVHSSDLTCFSVVMGLSSMRPSLAVVVSDMRWLYPVALSVRTSGWDSLLWANVVARAGKSSGLAVVGGFWFVGSVLFSVAAVVVRVTLTVFRRLPPRRGP